MPRNVLLNPGPVTTTQTVKEALIVPDICHREKEFTYLLKTIREDLLRVVNAGSDYTSVLFASSGTGSVEACLTSVIPKGKKILVINNGSYGQRICDIAKRYYIDVVEIKLDIGQVLPLAEIEKQLAADHDIFAVAMVHHETSSGLLNPLKPVGAICHQMQRCFIVDAMSSFAGSEIDVNKEYVDFIISSSNKCLHGMPGISFVVCKKDSLLQTEGNARSFYFDLHKQYHSLEKSGQLAFTPPVQVAYSFKQALDEFFTETLVGRVERYRRNYQRLLSGLQEMGFKLMTPEDRQSQILMTVQFPSDGLIYDFDDLHDYLYQRGYTIYPKKLEIPHTFRLACIGDLQESDIDGFLQAMKSYMISQKEKKKEHI